MADKDYISQRLAGLSPEKREMLLKLLESKSHTIQPRNPEQRVPLTFSQQRLWIVDQLVGENSIYNEFNAIRLPHALDADIFRRAVNEIIRRHEALRTVVEAIDGEPVQRIKPSLILEIPLVDLRQLAPEAREPEAQRLATEQARVPMNLATGPLIRASLYRLDTTDYLFSLVMHHIICDGWSMGVFAVELSALYWSYLTKTPLALPELKLQYPDYAVWQRRAFNEQTLGSQLAYWRTQLAALPTFEFPTDRPRPAEFSFRGARHPVVISGTLYQSLTSLCKREGVTLHILLLAVLFVLLHRHSGQDDIAVGTPIAGRNRKELEPLIGFFINTLVLRADLSGDPPFLKLLDRIRKLSFAAYENQDVPFEQLVEELQPVRDKSRNPLIQMAYQMFQPPSNPGLNPDHVFPIKPMELGISKFDLSLHLQWGKDEIRGYIEYSTDLFDASSIERLIAHFNRLLQSIAADPAQTLSKLAMLTEDEERRLLTEWNATAVEYPRDASITSVFEAQARSTPDRVAVQFADSNLTYGELDKRSDWLAGKLRSLGVERGDAVGLLIERCLELPVALLGIAKSGAISVPLDPNYPTERLSYLISDSGAKVVMTKACFQEALTGVETETLLIENALCDVGETTRATAEISANDVVCLMYTSGTTGQPKGVAVTHRGILRLVKGVQYVRLNGDQVILQIAPITFDASSFEIWGSLLNGAKMVIYPPGPPSLDELGALIKKDGITLLFLTTSLFRQMVERNAGDFKAVRELITGGEAMPLSLAKAVWKELPRTQVFNAYGPTECTTFASMFPMRSMEEMGDNVPIGQPIENTTMFILDKYGNLVPVGVHGEICIGGDGVAPGYWNRPELTAASFVPDPFSGKPGGRLYRTGDIGKYREDGNILFLGRRDRQIKLSGYRIELAEVEAAITSYPDVAGVAVLIMTKDGDKRLTAFAELSPDRHLTFTELREYLSRLLPHYMIPTQLEILDKLPLTPSGKVDYSALSNLESAPLMGQGEHVPPRTTIEKLLVGMWKETLKAGTIGVTDNFFDLGGQSLIATRLLSRVREAFQAELTMRQFFDNPTIAGLAAILSQDQRQGKRAELLQTLGAFALEQADQQDPPVDTASL